MDICRNISSINNLIQQNLALCSACSISVNADHFSLEQTVFCEDCANPRENDISALGNMAANTDEDNNLLRSAEVDSLLLFSSEAEESDVLSWGNGPDTNNVGNSNIKIIKVQLVSALERIGELEKENKRLQELNTALSKHNLELIVENSDLMLRNISHVFSREQN
ncbi:hypothetical protein RclHR1_00880019 [Rhizophagus clarus]|nr:hypothetical protein RclHR1_00880019 [Rhizophagus clarus]